MCLTGCLEHGEAFAKEFIDTTFLWTPFWLNERELAIQEKGGVSSAPRFGEDGRTVWVGPDEASGHYALDAILPPEATQADVYAHASGLVDSVFQGYNATLLAYGQTGSGKTHSVMGRLDGDAAGSTDFRWIG